MRMLFKKFAGWFRRKKTAIQNSSYEASRLDFETQYVDEYQWYLDEYHR